MSKLSVFFPLSFFLINWGTLLFYNHILEQSFTDAVFNTCAYVFMVFFIKFNLDLFYDPEEKNEGVIENLLTHTTIDSQLTATEKIMIKTNMNEELIKNVKEIIKR